MTTAAEIMKRKLINGSMLTVDVTRQGLRNASVRTSSNSTIHLYNDDDIETSQLGRSASWSPAPARTKEGLTRMDDSTTEITSDLVDLSGCSFATLDSYGDSVLAAAVAPLLRQIDNPTNSIGGHNS